MTAPDGRSVAFTDVGPVRDAYWIHDFVDEARRASGTAATFARDDSQAAVWAP